MIRTPTIDYTVRLSETLLVIAEPITLLPDSNYQRICSKREEIIKFALKKLQGRERRVFKSRYANGQVPTLREVSHKMKISIEKVCDIEGRALKNIANIPDIIKALDPIAS
jgi:DNA-directed RNA polymerase sigma subunit (sigma70/sigma32)